MQPNPIARLDDLIRKYTIFDRVPDIGQYRRITGEVKGSCSFRGCTEPIAWEGAGGGGFLCEGHYDMLKTWITEARRGLMGGPSSALFSTD